MRVLGMIGLTAGGSLEVPDAPVVDIPLTHDDRNAEFTAFMSTAHEPLHQIGRAHV